MACVHHKSRLGAGKPCQAHFSPNPDLHPKFLSRSFIETLKFTINQIIRLIRQTIIYTPITLPSYSLTHITETMFSRTLLKQTRTALRASPSSSLATRAPSQTQSLLREAAWSRQSLGSVGRRWYSSEGEAKKEEEKKEATVEEKQKLEIEKKDKEIIDLKVCLGHSEL